VSGACSCSGRALARSRPTPSLPHAPRAPRLVSSTLLDAMSPCTCAAASIQALVDAPPCTLSLRISTCHSAATEKDSKVRMPDMRSGNVHVTVHRPAHTRCTCHQQHS